MTIESILLSITPFVPAGWGLELRAASVVAALLGAGLVLGMIARLAKRKAPVARAVAEIAPVTPEAATVEDLDPEEWVSGNVVHFDRQKAFGFIRCDRFKAPVRFETPALPKGRLHAPRIGETVRFKGRHGARRRPVALVVEPVRAAARAG